MNITKAKQVYDCIIVGSGASGGWAAKELTEKGLNVLVLEAGSRLDPARDFREHTWPYELPHRGYRTTEQRKRQHVQATCYACAEYTRHLFIDDIDHPYTTPSGKPFCWIRGRHVGGKTIMWGRQSYRFSDYDFKAGTHDGFGQDWPVRYSDIEPYYEKVEKFIGNLGRGEKPSSVTRQHFPPSHGADLRRPTVAPGLWGARHAFYHRESGRPDTPPQRQSSVPLLRILPSRLPLGILFQQPGLYAAGGRKDGAHDPAAEFHRPASTDGGGPFLADDGRPTGNYIPRVQNLARRHPKFIRGYGFQGGAGRSRFPGHASRVRGFGAGFKKAVRDDAPMPVQLSGFGEMLPCYENYVEIDKHRVDAWGVPVLRIDCGHSDNELAMAADIIETAKEILTTAGAEIQYAKGTSDPPGSGIHECGTARMGDDPETSVLNAFNQAHQVKNLFVVDGSAFVSQSSVNPTLTIMALTVRSCDFLAEQYRRGEL